MAAMAPPENNPVMQDQLAIIIQGFATTIDAKISEAKSEIFAQITESERRVKEEVREYVDEQDFGITQRNLDKAVSDWDEKINEMKTSVLNLE